MNKAKLKQSIKRAERNGDIRVELYKGKECVAVIFGDMGFEYSIEYVNKYGYGQVKTYALDIGRNENVRILFDDYREVYL